MVWTGVTRVRIAAPILVVACFSAAHVVLTELAVHVAGPAVVGARDSQFSAGASPSAFRYPIQIYGYGEDGMRVRTVRVKPDYTLAAFGGELLGSDRGEWGGELVFRDASGAFHQLIDRNVHGIVGMPFGIVVFTGLAHMGRSGGAIYSVVRRGDGVVAATLIHTLAGAPDAIRWTTRGDLIFQVDIEKPHFLRVFGGRSIRCLLLDKQGALRSQWCAAIL